MRVRCAHLGVLAVAAIVMAVAASSALAAAPTRVERDKTFRGQATIKAPCPGGTHVVSGGTGTEGGYGSILVLGSYPYDGSDKDSKPDDGWKAEMINRNSPLESAAYALCTKQSYSYPHEDFKFPRFKDGFGTVACPHGTHIISGGGRAGTLIGLLPDDDNDGNKLPDDQFVVHTESGASERTDGTAYAICGDTKVKYVSVNTPAITPHDEGGEFDAPCPDGSNVLGGGAGIDVGHRDGALNSLFPRTDDKLIGWGTYLDNYDGSNTHTGKVVAVCAT
jgi:hypothetical protein